MSSFEFSFLVSGLDAHADDFADRIYEAGCDDATVMLIRGLVAVCFARQAETFSDAVISAFRDVRKTGGTIERFEPDFLVSQSDIAKRANLTKAAVSLYVSGDRGTGFPPPYARITSAAPLWDWVAVSQWLHAHGQVSREAVIEARVARTVNLFVQSGEALPATEKMLAKRLRDAEMMLVAA